MIKYSRPKFFLSLLWIFHLHSCLPESVVIGRAEDSAVVAEADLLDEALARVGLLQEVRQPPRVPVDLEPARGVHFLSLFVSFRGRLSRRR